MVATHFLTISVLDSDLPRGGRACCGGLMPTLWVEAGAEMDRSKGTPAPVKENKHKYRQTGSYSTGLEISRFFCAFQKVHYCVHNGPPLDPILCASWIQSTASLPLNTSRN
jgi:hypothetical protein